jgi:uncharacterized membrane protein
LPVFEQPANQTRGELTGPTSTGVDARLSALLCYLAWWVSGLVFLVIEQEHREVRFHAAQSIVLFGGFSLLIFVMSLATFGMLFFLPAAFQAVYALSFLLSLIAVMVWLTVLLKIFKGESWRVPFAADLAAKLVAR